MTNTMVSPKKDTTVVGKNSLQDELKSTSSTSMVGDWSGGTGLLPGRENLGPILLMLITPCFSIIFFHVCANMNGDFIKFSQLCYDYGFFTTLYNIWPNPWDSETWIMIGSFLLFELLLMKIVPGRDFVATVTPTGHRPVYKANGTASYIITLVVLVLLNSTGTYRISKVYDKFGTIISSMNVFAWIFCFLLVLKGHYAPSGTDGGSNNGNYIIDFYWGMELFPRIYGWDVKQFTNCRAGLMFWAVAILCFCAKNMELSSDGQLQVGLAVSVALQLIYLTKFYHWEMGYMCTMDIQHDRAGYYICWGCLVWVPSVYTSAAFYLTTSAPDISFVTATIIFLLGTLCIWINYDSDHQRYIFRQTNGNCTIWGRNPPNHIVAQYKTTSGDTKASLLLVDGWWKISRHFHYVPEILASFFWSVPALQTGLIGPYFYVIYLTILLTDRAFRDDDRCSKKYGEHWVEYCTAVPYKIVPGVV